MTFLKGTWARRETGTELPVITGLQRTLDELQLVGNKPFE
jgi:hypothetical protein